jgi:hypothetical protein
MVDQEMATGTIQREGVLRVQGDLLESPVNSALLLGSTVIGKMADMVLLPLVLVAQMKIRGTIGIDRHKVRVIEIQQVSPLTKGVL